MRRPSFYSKFFTYSVIMMVLKHPKRTNVVSSEMRCLGSYSGLNTLTKKRCLLLLLVIKTQRFGVVLLDVCETFLYTHDLHRIKQTELENNSFLLAFTVISCSLCVFFYSCSVVILIDTLWSPTDLFLRLKRSLYEFIPDPGAVAFR